MPLQHTKQREEQGTDDQVVIISLRAHLIQDVVGQEMRLGVLAGCDDGLVRFEL